MPISRVPTIPPWNVDLLELGEIHSRPGTVFIPSGLELHSTADEGATAVEIRNYFDQLGAGIVAAHPGPTGSEVSLSMVWLWHQSIELLGVEASCHLVVDDTQALCIIPCLPTDSYQGWWSEIAWHAGPTANHRYVSLEMCEFDDPAKFHQVYLRTIAVVNWLFDTWGWHITANTDDDGGVWAPGLTLCSHNQTSHWWKETNHTDPLPYLTKHGHTWEGFVHDIITRRVA